MRADNDLTTWDKNLQMLSRIELKLDHGNWLASLLVDKDTFKRAEKISPMPSELYMPPDLKAKYKELEAEKERQERSERAEAVLRNTEHLKAFLAAPRIAIEEGAQDY